MDYRLATAMRGPDHSSVGAGEWKALVTAPLRWFAARIMKRNPQKWARGSVNNPTEVCRLLAENLFVARAAKFAGSNSAFHVKSHARDAFEALQGTSQEDVAEELWKALRKADLL